MKKNVKVFAMFVMALAIFCLFSLKGESIVKAAQYTFESGTITRKYKDNKILAYSFNYDYKSQFKEDGGFYKGYDIKDNGVSLRQKTFYSGQSITLTAELGHEWYEIKHDDRTVIYKYNFYKESFDSSVYTFIDKNESYTIKEEGLYKIVYSYSGVSQFVDYVYVTLNLLESEVSVDRETDDPVYSSLTFSLNIKDAYDLSSYKFYYAFGANPSNISSLSYTELQDLNISGNVVDDKEVTINIRESDVTENGVKKHLFIKAVKDGIETVFYTESSFEIYRSLPVLVYVLDNEGNLLEDNVAYFRQGDILKFRLVFAKPVTFENMMYGIVSGQSVYDIVNQVSETTVVEIEHVLEDSYVEDFVGVFELLTKGNNHAVVMCNGENILLGVTLKSEYRVDVNDPFIAINGEIKDSVDNENNRADFVVHDSNLKTVEYYVKVCENVVENECGDSFDENYPNKIVVQAEGESYSADVLIKNMGEFNGEKLVLFVKATDYVGNNTFVSKYGYMVDNVIVNEEDKEKLFEKIDVLETIEDVETKVGERLIVNVEGYNVESVEFAFNDSETYYSCEVYEEFSFSCLDVRSYLDVDVKVKLTDRYLNVEEHTYEFKYNNLIPTLSEYPFVVGEFSFNVYDDKDYDMESLNNYNYIGVNDDRLVINEEILDAIISKLGIIDVTNLTVDLLYFNGEEKIVIVENVGNELVIPSTIELLDKLSHIETYSSCSLKGEICSFDLYLEYSYNSSYSLVVDEQPVVIDDLSHARLIKLGFVDNSLKFDVDSFDASVDVDYGGIYNQLTYTVIDSLNTEIDLNSATVTKKIIYIDRNSVSTEVASVDTNKLGTYIITEVVASNDLSTLPLNYVVNVVDKVAPSIRFKNTDKITVKIKDDLDINELIKDVVVLDNCDEDLEVFYSWKEPFDSHEEGIYTISFWTVDDSGNESEVVTRTIEVVNESAFITYLIIGGIFVLVIIIIISAIAKERKKFRKS